MQNHGMYLSVKGVSVAVLALLEPDVDVHTTALLLSEREICHHGEE